MESTSERAVGASNLPESPIGLARLLEAVTDQLSTVCLTEMTDEASVEVVKIVERARNKSIVVSARTALEVSDRDAFRADGFYNLYPFLCQGLRLGTAETRRRMTQLRSLASLTSAQGEQLAPKLPSTAAAVTDGALTADHVAVIATVMTKIPSAITPDVVARAEETLAEVARELTPHDTARAGDRIVAHLDPDGQATDDADRRRRRGLTLAQQDTQLMSSLRGTLTPELRAKLDAILTRWAAPGMNNPDDPNSPSGSGDTVDAAQLDDARDRDLRSQSQRNHDALVALCDFVIGNRGLGQPDRLPAEIVITTTLSELATHAGFGFTSTGTHLPIGDLLNLAADASTHLAVFKDHTAEILYLARGKRFANKAQRLALFARDRGCTAPGCDVPFARTEAHHMPDWADGGPTDIDHLGAACGKHNRSVGNQPGRWTTTITANGRVGWRPNGKPDQPYRVNSAHHAYLNITRPPKPDKPDRPTARAKHHSVVEARLTVADISRLQPITDIIIGRQLVP
ncbi:hypothetical protein GOEFS_115_00090 [Gordonia effusa NBRC 100432]|uniref:HNH nuclease domain-containing protein n=1 Tax=Gordonia effusa NBRC 100432 TaxID=1077974 RepID=H0R5L8_9ACTN|nr:HNH endonuclease signature motif containing protein [Gordonia effusa]GAB20369.1 hypothetical protein GOEFS_115_00090 [Gordonia effusa NBRC 100432]